MADLNNAVETVTGVVETVTDGEEGFFDTVLGKIIKIAAPPVVAFVGGYLLKGKIDGTLPALPGKKQTETDQVAADVKAECNEDAEK